MIATDTNRKCSAYSKKVALLCIAAFTTACSEQPQGLNPNDELIPFFFVKKPLLTLIDELAQKKNLNIIYPPEPDALAALMRQTITFEPKTQRIPVQEAWNLLQTFIELSTFSLIHKGGPLYAIVKAMGPDGPNATRDVLPLYVNTKQVPKSDERIRYIYYPRNFKVPTMQEKDAYPLTKALKDLLSNGSTILYDPSSNALIMVDKAWHIANALSILDAFDALGFHEDIKYVHLNNVPAADVVKIFDSIKKAAGEEHSAYPFIRDDTQPESFAHFAADTKVVPDERGNGVIIIGRPAHTERISDFITQSLDVAPDEGLSILHAYNLQYLDAQTFAPQLQKIVSSFTQEGQAKQAHAPQGQERFFQGVVVTAEGLVESKKESTTEAVTSAQKEIEGIEMPVMVGGNRLIIAARQDDWRFIKKLIEKLDIPQYQVVLEMFLVDFTYDRSAGLEGDIRSKTDSMLPRGVQFLASNITDVNTVLGSTPTQLASDLLQVVGPGNVSNQLAPGSMLISFNDPKTPGIWGLLATLEKVLKANITTSPYLFVSNHKKGSVESQEIIRTKGDLSVVTGGSFTIPVIDLAATIKVEAVPHIMTENKVRLDIALTVEEFVSGTLNRLTRYMKTTSTLHNNQILAMGGLIRSATIELETEHLFSRIFL